MKSVAVIAAIAILSFSCTKRKNTTAPTPGRTTTFSDSADLLGYSFFMNDCSAKYWIKIYNPAASNTFDTLPAGSGIDPGAATAGAPVKVWVNWHNAPACRVVIDAIARR